MSKATKYRKIYEKNEMSGYPSLRKVFYIIKENQKPIYFRDIRIICEKNGIFYCYLFSEKLPSSFIAY